MTVLVENGRDHQISAGGAAQADRPPEGKHPKCRYSCRDWTLKTDSKIGAN